MPTSTFNTTAGQTIKRHLMILYYNTGTYASPTWEAIGKRITDSDMSFDWNSETNRDILGNVFTTMDDPIVTQDFDNDFLDAGNAATVSIWEKAIRDHDAQALANLDLLVGHFYAGTSGSPTAERYPSSAIEVSSLGGEGGGNLAMSYSVTFGGARETGTVSKDASTGAISFTKAA